MKRLIMLVSILCPFNQLFPIKHLKHSKSSPSLGTIVRKTPGPATPRDRKELRRSIRGLPEGTDSVVLLLKMDGECKRRKEDLKVVEARLAECEESLSTSHGPQILLTLEKWQLLKEKSALEAKIESTAHKREVLARSILEASGEN
jgi:hypothetical protein